MAAKNILLVMLLSLLALLTAVEAACDSNEPLGDPDPDDDAVTVTYSSFITSIKLKEGYPNTTQTDVSIAVFNCDESDVPTITRFQGGSNTNLGLDTDNRNGKWYLIVKITQDYENPIQRSYRFYVDVGGIPYEVYITVVNVDDETPYFYLPDSSPCEIKETLIGQTTCRLLVYDADTIMDDMKYRVLESGEESENISLVLADTDLCKTVTPQDCLTVAVNIKKEIEFIDKPVHSLLLEVEDQAGHIGNMTYIVQVIAVNKEIPYITPQKLTVEIDEETPGIIAISGTTITVQDRDALDYGQFIISLEGNGSDNCYEAFDVIPRAGYRKTDVRLSVIAPEKLDYDEGSCNDIIVKIKATEIGDENRVGEAEVNVRLRDLNDETPKFEEEEEEYVFVAAEHEALGKVLGSVKAIDRDATDKVTYSLTSNAYLTVDPDNGSVKVNADFDYERQPQVFATVKAEDTNKPPHFSYAQIMVNITDIDDEKPVLYVPSSPTDIDEVSAIGTELNVEIKATDIDTVPDLLFSIDWDTSRAAKQGIPQKLELFKECLKIKTVKDSKNLNDASAVLKVDKIIHWEDFDTLYVNISVEDRNTHPDYQQNRLASAILIITLKDINDCAPEFSDIGNLTFKENTGEGPLVQNIYATDRDGPGFNVVKYSIINELYQEEYVTINEDSGELRTGKDQIDFEEIEEIYYTIVASDGELKTLKNITIQIEDVNDCTPYFIGDYSEHIYLDENTDVRTDLLPMDARDNDTSPQFHTLRYFMEDAYRGTFEIDFVSGQVYLPDGQGSKIDYEKLKSYVIEITVRDRCDKDDFCYGDSLSSSTRITIELLDVNDNPPIIQNGGGVLRTIAEDEAKSGVYLGVVTATDADSGINADLNFTFVDPTPAETRELFGIIKDGAQRASITVKKDLLDKPGKYTLTVMANDIGNLTDIADFTIIVTDINNNKPVFVYPNETTVIRLNLSGNKLNTGLTEVNGRKVVFSAIDDEDKGLNGTEGMSYDIIGDGIASEYLKISRDELWLIKDFDQDMDKKFTLKVEACDGEFENDKQCTEMETDVRLRVNIQYEPTFDILEWKTNFTENKTGLTEVKKIEVKVTDLNNADECKDADECEIDKIYYFILDGDKDIFILDRDSGDLSLKQELDREKIDLYTLTVFVTNYEDGQHVPEENSKLKVTIQVIDIIDTPPVFTRELFAAGINYGDKVNAEVTALTATDEDLDDELTYTIVADSMSVTDNSLQNWVNRSPFKISGENLQLNFNVEDNSLRGIFKFDVRVTDKGNFIDEAACQIYIITQDNLVNMRFLNNESFVASKRAEIAEIYTNVFKSQSNVKNVARALNSEGVAVEDQTDVTSYFVDENKQQPINKEEITKELNNKQTYNELKDALLGQKLLLDTIDNTQSETVANLEGILQTVLIVVSVVLGTLVVVLFAAFFVRTRSLNRRLEALSTTKFGSQDSGLNRIGLAVPNTNQHAVEGSNPIWGNEELVDRNFDNASLSSGDSDLIGVEENPEFSPYGQSGFANNGFTPELESGRRVSVNPMLASGLNPLSAAALQDVTAANKTTNKRVNPMAGMFNSNGDDSDNDSRPSSENVKGQNSNFSFFGRMDSIPTTEL